MKNIVKCAKVVTKIVEVFHWVGCGMMLAAAVCALAAPELVHYFVSVTAKECCGAELNVYGFEIIAAVENGNMDMKTFFLFGIGAVVILFLMAMIFHNLNGIIKKAEVSTPFHADNVRLLNQIGAFAIAIPAVGLVMSWVSVLVLGAEAVETSVNLEGFVMGLIILCLTRFFAYGAELEKDVDGLL